MTDTVNTMAEMLEKQVPILELEGYFETAVEAASTARVLRLLAELEAH